MGRNPHTRRAARPLLAALVTLLGASDTPARAQTLPQGSSNFYVGFSLPAGRLAATMQKTVDNTAPHTLVPEPRRGEVFHDEVVGDGFAYGLAVNAGYRLPLSDDAYYLDGSLDVEWHGGSLEAQFAGVGVSPERKQLGESWPDRWSVEKQRSHGATLRLGASPRGLRVRDLSLYLMAGVRFTDVRLNSDYNGCFSPEPCEPHEFGSGTETLDLDFLGWRSGIGAEKRVGEQLSIRVEASYSAHAREDWVTPFDALGVTVDSSIDAYEIGLTLGVVRRF